MIDHLIELAKDKHSDPRRHSQALAGLGNMLLRGSENSLEEILKIDLPDDILFELFHSIQCMEGKVWRQYPTKWPLPSQSTIPLFHMLPVQIKLSPITLNLLTEKRVKSIGKLSLLLYPNVEMALTAIMATKIAWPEAKEIEKRSALYTEMSPFFRQDPKKFLLRGPLLPKVFEEFFDTYSITHRAMFFKYRDLLFNSPKRLAKVGRTEMHDAVNLTLKLEEHVRDQSVPSLEARIQAWRSSNGNN